MPCKTARSIGAAIAIAAAACPLGLLNRAEATDIPWLSPSPGYFDDATRWSGGRIPGTSDSAVFRLGSTTSYKVTFRKHTTNQRLLIPDDTVEFSIGETTPYFYNLSPTLATPSVVVGAYVSVLSDNSGDLLLSYGNLKSPDGIIARDAESAGLVTVSGASTSWQCGGLMQVGLEGDGSLYLQSQGTVSTGTLQVGVNDFSTGEIVVGLDGIASTLNTAAATLGIAENSWGLATVQSGSTWTAVFPGAGPVPLYAPLVLGVAGEGALDIESGATVTNGPATLGASLTGEGDVTVDDATWTNHGALQVGTAGGSGSIAIMDGGQVTSDSGVLGDGGGSGQVTISGANSAGQPSRWTISGDLEVGRDGSGSLDISAGSRVSAVNAFIAPRIGSSGSVQLDGTGSDMTLTDSLYIGGDQSGPAGEGSVIVSQAATLTVANAITVWGSGTLRVEDGAVSAAAIALSGGKITGFGSLQPPIEAASGEIQPDANTTLTLNGGLSIASGATLVKSGAGALAVGGVQAHALGSTLHVTQGKLILNTDAGALGEANLSIVADSGTAVEFAFTQHLAQLSLAGASANLAPGQALDLQGLAMDPAAKLDVDSGGMILHNGDIAAVNLLIASARNGGAWDGNGLTSRMVADSLGALGLAAIVNDRGDGTPIFPTFGGEMVDARSILVAPAHIGDADLNGIIDADDYFRMDAGSLRNLGGWANGDFNYSGTVDSDDYQAIDAAYLAGRALSGAPVQATAVPEPFAFAPALAALLMLARMPRQRRRA